MGIGCLSVDRELSVSETFRREALDSIGNSLSAVQDPQDIDELGLAWLDLGGAPARVATVLDAQVKHVGPDGLVRLAAQPSGSLDSTYAVLRIRVALQGEPDDPEAAAAVQTLVTSGRLRTPLELLEAAAVLQEAGHPDAALATQAAGQVHGSVPSQVTAANLPTWARAADLLAVLGQPPARASVDPGGASARETRYLTWLVLAHLDAVDGTGTLDRYRAVLTAIPQVLATEGERLSTAELVAALRAWAVVGTGSALDLPSVRSLVASRLGCPGWPEIFSTAAGSTDCDLESTMTLLEGVPGTKELMASGGHS